jgi:uroporphyrinogen-III synthase
MTELGKIWLVYAALGIPESLTVRGRELLEQATVVSFREEHRTLLEGCRSDVMKRLSNAAESVSVSVLIDDAKRGHRVVYLVNPNGVTVESLESMLDAFEVAQVPFALVPGVANLSSNALERITRVFLQPRVTLSEVMPQVTRVTSTDSKECFNPALLPSFLFKEYDSGPLFGKRLLLPRPIEQSRASAVAIRARGAVPVVFPLLTIEDPEEKHRVDEAIQQLSIYDWVLLTSANGTKRLIDAVQRNGLDARALGGVKIGVIGPKTAEPLKAFGLTADLIAEEHVAEGLLLALASQQRMRRVLLFRAAEAREVLPEVLRARGVTVDVVAAYRTRRLGFEAGEPLRQLLREGHLDAVLVTSSSMAISLVDALGDAAPKLLEGTKVASIGPVTTKTLEDLGVRVGIVARKYTVDGLLDALTDEWLPKS